MQQFQSSGQRIAAASERNAQRSLSALTISSTVYDNHAVIMQQAPPDVVGGQSGAGNIEHGKESTFGSHHVDGRKARQGINRQLAPLGIRLTHLAYTILWSGQCRRASVLDERCVAAAGLL